MDYKLLEEALVLSAKAHAGQTRKGTDIPYITHPVALAMTLIDLGCADEVVAAALLHDVVEDTSISLADIEQKFGPEITEIVRGVSEPDREASWEERKQHTIDKLRHAPLPIKLVSCADKLHNIRSMIRDYAKLGETLWERFNRGKDRQAWYYRGLAESLPYGIEQPEQYPIFGQFVQEVDKLFGHKKINVYELETRFLP
jgi:(p)ppGpp synthase/HD superfamily hydrolase